MKKVLLTVCVLLFLQGTLLGQTAPLANAEKSGLYARSIEQIMRLEDEEIDLGTAVLVISSEWNPDVNWRRYIVKLDDMAYEIRRRLKAKNIGVNHKAIAVINNYLYDELGFRSVSEAKEPRDLFLHSVLDKERGYCLSLSILYLSLGERLGLPLYGVVVPGHFFVRYDRGGVRFNIEATSKGGYAEDEHYREKFNVPDAGRDHIYMLNLNKVQTIGCFLNNLGSVYTDVGDTEAALLAFKRAVEINPSLSESRANLGNTYLQRGMTDEAIQQYQMALRINPNNAPIHRSLGDAYSQREWFNSAITEYMQALRLDTEFVEAYKGLASAYCKQQMYGKAVAQLVHVLGLEPDDADCYRQMGDVYRQMGDCTEAIFQYEKALEIDRRLAEAHYGLGVCYNKLGQSDDEIRAYKNALSIKPDMVGALINLGNVYFREEEYDDAIRHYKKAAALKSDDAVVHYNLGSAYSNKENYIQAAAAYRKAIELEPAMGDAHRGLGFAYYNLKKYEQALGQAKRAEELGAEGSAELLKAIEKKLR